MKTNAKLLPAALLMAAIMHAFAQPTIVTQPWDQAVEAGANSTFRIVAAGTSPLTYQWRQNGVEVPGANAATLALPNVQSANAGKYTVVVTDVGGSVTSQVARLRVHVPTMLFAVTNQWKFDQSGTDLGSSWNGVGFDDANWPEGRAGFYNETGATLLPKLTPLALTNSLGLKINTYYFRTHFTFTGSTAGVFLVATNYVDDGAVFYLNGAECGRLRLPAGSINASTAATIAQERKPDVLLFPSGALVSGGNVLAVEVHQESLINADVVFGMSLKATTLAPLLPDLIIPPPPKPHIELQTFATNACEVLEGCGVAGVRRLLRFDIEARNAGTGDMVLGDPTANPQFDFDNCHGHYHFDHFAGFRLLDQNGAEVSVGKKIGFGLADVDRWDTTNAAPNPRFNGSSLHGIQAGWSDTYSFQVPCQYVDLTDIAPGTYLLELEIDPENKIPELDESNNITRVTIEIPENWSPCTTPPANDNFASAQIVPPGVTTVFGTTECATLEPGEPVIRDSYSNHGVRSIWFRWTAPATGGLTLDTIGSTFPTVLGLYRGTALTGLTLLGADADFRGPARTSRVMANVTAGETYAIAVDGYFDDRDFVRRDTFGSAVLNLHLNTNDLFAAAQKLHGVAGSARATTAGATKEVSEPNHAANPGGRSLWYSWTAPVSGSMVFDTYGSTFNRGYSGQNNTVNTLLAVYAGAGLESLNHVASNDDANQALVSRVVFDAKAGTTYYIAVDSRTGASAIGLCQLNWRPRLTLDAPLIVGGNARFMLRGEPTEDCVIETSPDLVTWTLWRRVTNSNGALELTDALETNAKFYRARIE